MQNFLFVYLVDLVSSTSLDSVVGLAPALDLVQSRLGVDGLFVQDIDSTYIVRLDGLKLLRQVLSDLVVKLDRRYFRASVGGHR